MAPAIKRNGYDGDKSRLRTAILRASMELEKADNILATTAVKFRLMSQESEELLQILERVEGFTKMLMRRLR